MDSLLNQKKRNQPLLICQLKRLFCSLMVAMLAVVFAPRVWASEPSAGYENDLVLRADRLEQEDQKNKSQASRLSGLFDPVEGQKIKSYQEKALEERDHMVDQLFQEEVPAVESLDKDALFAETSNKIVYQQAGQTQEEGRFALVFYGILATVVLGSFIYICYLFLKG